MSSNVSLNPFKNTRITVFEYDVDDDNVNQIKDILFYITPTNLPYHCIIDMIRMKSPCITSSCNLILDRMQKTIMIKWIETHKRYQKQGYADVLLKHIINYCKENGYARIDLDDTTTRYRKPRNLYVNNGFKYVEPDDASMILYL